jgi:transcriptional regulator with XRE-family HTH domain
MSQIDILLGRSISEQRLKSGISQEELARKLGLSVQTVAAFELGARRASAKQLFEIAEVLDLKIERLFDDLEGEPVESKPSTAPFGSDIDKLAGHYDALSKSHRAAIFAFLLALRQDKEENPAHMP